MKYIFIIATVCLMFFFISWLFPPKPLCNGSGVVTGGACSLEDLGYIKPKKLNDTEFNQEKMYYKNFLPLSKNSSTLKFSLCEIGNCQ